MQQHWVAHWLPSSIKFYLIKFAALSSKSVVCAEMALYNRNCMQYFFCKIYSLLRGIAFEIGCYIVETDWTCCIYPRNFQSGISKTPVDCIFCRDGYGVIPVAAYIQGNLHFLLLVFWLALLYWRIVLLKPNSGNRHCLS